MKIAYRFWIATLVFFSTFINYAHRVNMSVSVIAMSKPIAKKSKISHCDKLRGITEAPTTNETVLEPLLDQLALSEAKTEDKWSMRFDWDQVVQGHILAAYGYGYIVSCIPGGFCAEYFGPFKTLFWANLISSVVTAAIIPAAMAHWIVVFVLRFLVGVCGGLVYPALQILISRWAPPNEKGKFVSALMGNTLGTCTTFPIVGWISDKFNWAWGFIFVALEGVVYLITIFFFLSDSPETARFISEEERDYLKEAIGGGKKKTVESHELKSLNGEETETSKTSTEVKLIPPYRKIFTSVPFYALAMLHFANLYGLFITLLSVPKFMTESLGFDLKSAGGLSALPPFLRLFTGVAFGAMGDYFKGKYPTSILRKSYVLFSHIIPGICIMSLMFVECDWLTATILLIACQGFNAAVVLTNLQNPQDLAPNFAGTIFGVISVIAGVSQFIVPMITAVFTKNGSTMEEWKWIFILGGCVYFAGSLIFILFGSAEKQSWNEVEITEEKSESEEIEAVTTKVN